MKGPTLLVVLSLTVLILALVGMLIATSRVIRAVFLRNVTSYFTGVLGYLFISAFVVAAGFMAFDPQFFTDNLVSLAHLSKLFPWLLLFLVPAVTMASWSDERKLGTDELLFTLPARDWEILAGKYLGVLAVYTAALGFSFPLWMWMGWLGSPDWGVMFSTYLGYWLAGAALLAIGMFASVLTSSATVAYVLGALFCAVPVFIDKFLPSRETIRALGELSGDPESYNVVRKAWGGLWTTLSWIFPTEDFIRQLTIAERLRDFELGTVPLTGVLYFVSLAAFALYLNLIFISRRHWSSSQETRMGLQFFVRAVAVVAVLVSANVCVGLVFAKQIDLTEERLFSLSPTTRGVLSKIDAKRPVMIQAFISPSVPQDYVSVRTRLIGLLREYDRRGGALIDVRFVDVEPFSPESDEAKSAGMQQEKSTTERDGRMTEETFFLGAVVSSSFDEVVIPLFNPGTPIEYELTRSIRTVANEKRLKVGVLNTDAQVLSGSSEWRIVTELKKQYQVEEVSADSPIDEKKYDVLLAVLPSSLSDRQLPNLVDYVKKGKPTLIFDDPFPYYFSSRFGTVNCPRQTKPRPGGMFGMGGPPPEPKADDGRLTPLLQQLDLVWDNGRVAWDSFNPHPKYESVPLEYLFITPQNGLASAISQKSDVTKGLQEIMMAYAGTLLQKKGSSLVLEPLLRTSTNSGLLEWDEFSRDGFDPSRMQSTRQLIPNPPRPPGDDAHVLAYHITSKKEKGPNVIFVADLDCISDWFFFMRDRGDEQLKFDNVAFVLNAVDVLAGDAAYIELRRRRSELRTLTKFEERTREFDKQRRDKESQADKDAKKTLDEAKERFKKQREEIEKDKTLDDQTKETMIESIRETEQRRIDVASKNIEREKLERIDKIKAETRRSINGEVNWIRNWAILSLPLPAILLGGIVLLTRMQSERKSIKSSRLVK